MPGWSLVLWGVLMIASIQVLLFGVLAEYMARIYDEGEAAPCI